MRSGKAALASVVALALVTVACQRSTALDLDLRGSSVILVSLDTVRADHLSHHGYARDTTPFLARLAERCLVFDQAVAQSASTIPSHRALLTSRYAWHVRKGDPYLAESFAAAGYETAAFTGAGGVSAELGFSPGFGLWVEAKDAHRSLNDNLPLLSRWLAARAGDKPSFLFVHTYDAHHPYDPPAPYDTLFFPEYRGPVTGPATASLLSKLARMPPNANFSGYVPFTVEDRAKIVALYDGQLRYLDDRLRDLFALLETGGLRDRSLIVITSDHGEEFWEHDGVLHSHTLHEELVHVPLLVCLPGRAAMHRRITQVVRHIDLAPTILDLVGVAAPPSFRGFSLRPVLERDADLDLPGISELNWFKSIRDRRHKLLVDQRFRRLILFDLDRDPGERSDHFARNPQQALALHKTLSAELGEGMNASVSALDADAVTSRQLRQQLRALGYLQ